MTKTYTVGIIGTGASGIAVFVHLLQKMIRALPQQRGLSILLAERDHEMGTGLAFGTGQKGHLLNTKAGIMGIYADEPLHFVQWMHKHKDAIEKEFPQCTIHPDAYPPRMLYGKYLQDSLKDHLDLAKKHGIHVERIYEEVLDIDLGKDTSTLHFASGKQRTARWLVLATGNPKSAAFKGLSDCKNYFDSPWPSSRILEGIKDKAAHVGIIGSSLTAIDGVKTLIDNGHQGPISLFSKKGLIPRIQAPEEPPFERKVLTLENIRKLMREQNRSLRIKDLIRLFRAEVEGHLKERLVWRDHDPIGKAHTELLKEDIQKALGATSVFQNILNATRYDSYTIWKLLPPDQQQLYGKWIKAHVDINRHAMPVENGIKILKLLESGQLSIRYESDTVHYDHKEQVFLMKIKDGEDFTVDYVINATGPAIQLEDMDDIPLIKNLLKKGLLVPYATGGASADLNTMRLNMPEMAASPLYGIGHLLGGMQIDINALWFNVARADEMTDDIINRVRKWMS